MGPSAGLFTTSVKDGGKNINVKPTKIAKMAVNKE